MAEKDEFSSLMSVGKIYGSGTTVWIVVLVFTCLKWSVMWDDPYGKAFILLHIILPLPFLLVLVMFVGCFLCCFYCISKKLEPSEVQADNC